MVLANTRRGIDRFTSLLSQLNLMDHLVTEASTSADIENAFREIDYVEVFKLIDQLRVDSHSFLDAALQ